MGDLAIGITCAVVVLAFVAVPIGFSIAENNSDRQFKAKCMESGGMVLDGQPIYCVKTNSVLGVEP